MTLIRSNDNGESFRSIMNRFSMYWIQGTIFVFFIALAIEYGDPRILFGSVVQIAITSMFMLDMLKAIVIHSIFQFILLIYTSVLHTVRLFNLADTKNLEIFEIQQNNWAMIALILYQMFYLKTVMEHILFVQNRRENSEDFDGNCEKTRLFDDV